MAEISGTPLADEIDGTTTEGDLIEGLGGNDTLRGLDGDDTIFGGSGADRLYAGAGDDVLHGDGGNDVLVGGAGRQQLFGGAGRDQVFLNDGASSQSSEAYGGAGRDWFQIEANNQGVIDGGAGNDRLVVNWQGHVGVVVRADGPDWVLTSSATPPGAAEAESLQITATSVEALTLTLDTLNEGDDIVTGGGNDVIDVSGGTNRVLTGAGNDQVTYISNGANVLDGGAGIDTLHAILRDASYFVVADDGTADDGMGSTITGFERYRVEGTGFDDIISLGSRNDTATGDVGNDMMLGGAGRDRLFGGAGADTLHGQGGDDALFGGTRSDVLYGGFGADTLAGGAWNDTLFGGAGADVFLLTSTDEGVDRIGDFEVGIDQLHLLAQNFLVSDPADPAEALPTGAVAADRFSIGAPVGEQAQFVRSYDSDADVTYLFWDRNGELPSAGLAAFLVFDGDVAITATDLLIV